MMGKKSLMHMSRVLPLSHFLMASITKRRVQAVNPQGQLDAPSGIRLSFQQFLVPYLAKPSEHAEPASAFIPRLLVIAYLVEASLGVLVLGVP